MFSRLCLHHLRNTYRFGLDGWPLNFFRFAYQLQNINSYHAGIDLASEVLKAPASRQGRLSIEANGVNNAIKQTKTQTETNKECIVNSPIHYPVFDQHE